MQLKRLVKRKVWPAARKLNNLYKFLFRSWTIGVFGAVFNKDGEILLVKDPNEVYSLPGGGVSPKDEIHYSSEENDFAFSQTLRREIEEETGLTITGVDKDTQSSYPYSKGISGDNAICVVVTDYKGQIDVHQSIEVEALGFYDRDKALEILEGRMQEAAKEAFKQYQED